MARYFYSIDQDKLLQLPKSILYEIITNKNLKLRDEDMLIEFIQKVYSTYSEYFDDEDEEKDDEEKINIISFYEAVDFLSLSESKFDEFAQNFESRIMTKRLWKKLYPCFYTNFGKQTRKKSNK